MRTRVAIVRSRHGLVARRLSDDFDALFANRRDLGSVTERTTREPPRAHEGVLAHSLDASTEYILRARRNIAPVFSSGQPIPTPFRAIRW
jgi:hypothetical protein